MFSSEALDDPLMIDTCPAFNGGVFSDARPVTLQPNQAYLMKNMEIAVNGDATTRRGCSRLGAGYVEDGGAATGGRWIQGMHGYNVGSNNYLMAVNNRALWRYNGSVWAQITGYAAGALLIHTQIPVCMVQGNNKLYLSDTFSNITQWDGTTFTDLGSGGATQPPFGCACIVWHTNRLVAGGCVTLKDTVAFSDILDATTWDTALSNLSPGEGDGETVQGLYSWTDFNLLVFKRSSIWMINCNPVLDVADFEIRRVTGEVGVIAWRTAAQVGSDVFVLTNDGVRSISRTLASETQQDIGQAISAPVADIIRRINPAKLSLCHATEWNHRYILFLPLDSSNYPNYALVYNTLTQSWSGYWTGWTALCTARRVHSDGTMRFCFGDAGGYAKEFLDYVTLTNEVIASYRDDGNEIPIQLDTRALDFGDTLSPKTGLNYEVEYECNLFGQTMDAPTILSVDQSAGVSSAKTFSTTTGTTTRDAFDLQARPPFREARFRVTSSGGKVSVKRITATAFENTLVLQT